MRKTKTLPRKRILAVLLALIMAFGILPIHASADSGPISMVIEDRTEFYVSLEEVEAAMRASLDWLLTGPAPQFGSVGGEWTVLALARAGHPVPPGYFENYLNHIGDRLTNVWVTTDPNSTQMFNGTYNGNRVFNPATGRYEVRLGNQAQSTENVRLTIALGSHWRSVSRKGF